MPKLRVSFFKAVTSEEVIHRYNSRDYNNKRHRNHYNGGNTPETIVA